MTATPSRATAPSGSATLSTTTLLVIAKEPVAGRVKTRLQSRFTPQQAADLAAASLADTLAAVLAADVEHRVLALDGVGGDWLPAGFTVVEQGTGGLDRRLAAAFGQAFGHSPAGARVLLVGMDTPQLTPELLTPDWDGADAVLGLSEDGGFWAVGLNRPVPGAFEGVPMSTGHTGADQLARLRALGLRVHLLPVLRDVDTPDDATVVAALAPRTRFARLHQQLAGPLHHPMDLYGAALDGRRIRVELADGRMMPLVVDRWTGAPDSIDRMMLNRCEGTILDVGCGPGRLVGALAEAGLPALGVDVSHRAVELTAERGACVLRRPVEGPLPGEGRWGTVLLADGNLGIGGDPVALLRRCWTLLVPGGLLLVEADPEDVDEVAPITLIDAAGRRATPLPWARLGSIALARVAAGVGFVVVEEWRAAGRVFLALRSVAEPGSPVEPGMSAEPVLVAVPLGSGTG